jgi:hypothetical protein
MKTAIILLILVFASLSRLAAADQREVRLSGGLAKDVQVSQVLDFKELEKTNWSPGNGEVPLSPAKAILAATSFCNENLRGKVHPVLRELCLRSFNVEGTRRWFWVAIYPSLDDGEQIKGIGSPVAIPVSFSGHVMAEVEAGDKE